VYTSCVVKDLAPGAVRSEQMTPTIMPDYQFPPAVETLMGFYFARLPNWNVLRLGQLWTLFKNEYPNASVLPALPDAAETNPHAIDIEKLPIRAMFTDVEGGELLQVQGSAFFRNWRQTPENREYTHYSQLKPRFASDWQKLIKFIKDNQLQMPSVFQCEVTYMNHLVRGKDWDSYNDLARLVKLFAPREGVTDNGRHYSYLPEAASVALNVGYTFPEAGVSLQVVAQSAVRMPDGTEVLQLTVTAKGTPKHPSDQELWATLDRCHEAVILGFDDVTTENAHQKWGKR
jgi:uncharacterized protein (TIGR04255 family)